MPALYEYTHDQVERQTQLLRDLARHERYRQMYAWLTSIPGIGLVAGMTILLELGEMHRFERTDHLAAYVGLTPAQYSSGERIRLGRITRVGQSDLRGVLIEAAWIAMRYDDALAQTHRRIQCRSGSKRAIVAVARRLLMRCRRVFLDGRPYEMRPAAQ